MENKTFVMGDIHGNYRGMLQVFEKSGFNYEEDTLIQVGDVCDSWSEVKQCVDELLKIKNLVSIKGNHDDWFLSFIRTNHHPGDWDYGGKGTISSYKKNIEERTIEIPKTHQEFFQNQKIFYIDKQNRMFVHAGWEREFSVHSLLTSTSSLVRNDFFCNRNFWKQALSCSEDQKLKTIENFSEIFIGHTPTINWSTDKEISPSGLIIKVGKKKVTTPMFSGGVWNIDTGSGFKDGKLTLMNIDTKEYFQSDFSRDLYPDEEGR